MKRVVGQSDHEKDSSDKTRDEEIREDENETRSGGSEWEVTGEPQDNGSSPRKSWRALDFLKLELFRLAIISKDNPKGWRECCLFALERRVESFVQFP